MKVEFKYFTSFAFVYLFNCTNIRIHMAVLLIVSTNEQDLCVVILDIIIENKPSIDKPIAIHTCRT